VRRLIAASGIVLAVTVLSACGNSSDTSTTTSTRPSTSFATQEQNTETSIGAVINLLATTSQHGTASNFDLLTKQCRYVQMEIGRLKATPLPAGATQTASEQLAVALNDLDMAVTDCLNNASARNPTVLPQVLQILGQGWPLLHKTAVTLTEGE
jgi:hypothetical protein